MSKLKNINKTRLFQGAATLFIGFVFIQSLFFKFTNHPETQNIFGTLNEWTLSLGLPGLFEAPGPFNAYVIGTGELIASLLLLAGFFMRKRLLQTVGAGMAVGIMTGAVSFHLFTPLGIEVNNDGGALFTMAVIVWVLSLAMLVMNRDVVFSLLKGQKINPITS